MAFFGGSKRAVSDCLKKLFQNNEANRGKKLKFNGFIRVQI